MSGDTAARRSGNEPPLRRHGGSNVTPRPSGWPSCLPADRQVAAPPVDPITAAARCAFSSQHRYNVGTDRVVEGERQQHHLRLAVALFSSASAGIHEPPAVLDVGVMKVTKVNAI